MGIPVCDVGHIHINKTKGKTKVDCKLTLFS